MFFKNRVFLAGLIFLFLCGLREIAHSIPETNEMSSSVKGHGNENLLKSYHALKEQRDNNTITIAEFKQRRSVLIREKSSFVKPEETPLDKEGEAKPDQRDVIIEKKKKDTLEKYHALKKMKRDKVITDSEFQQRRTVLISGERQSEKSEGIQVASSSINDDYASSYEEVEDDLKSETPDTFETFNRAMFGFNNFLYDHVMDPVSRGYATITPGFFRVSVSNFFSNISMPVRLLSSVIQGSWEKTGRVLTRFFINSTAGLGGLFDVAKKQYDIDKVDEDFGQALGYHGVKPGPYVVWPIFGPSTLRGTAGAVMDTVANPIWILSPGMGTSVGVTAGKKINDISQNPDLKKEIDDMAVDSYLSVRDLYLQHRQAQVLE